LNSNRAWSAARAAVEAAQPGGAAVSAGESQLVSGETHRLQGVRLGKTERSMLQHAPRSQGLFGLVRNAPDAGVRATMRRAAKKSKGLNCSTVYG
jgi:hypothetical protein